MLLLLDTQLVAGRRNYFRSMDENLYKVDGIQYHGYFSTKSLPVFRQNSLNFSISILCPEATTINIMCIYLMRFSSIFVIFADLSAFSKNRFSELPSFVLLNLYLG